MKFNAGLLPDAESRRFKKNIYIEDIHSQLLTNLLLMLNAKVVLVSSRAGIQSCGEGVPQREQAFLLSC